MASTRKTRNSRPRARRPLYEDSASSATGEAWQRTRDRAASDDDTDTGPQEELLRGLQQAWLAGMGALARAQKDGPAAFTDAAFEGLRLLNTSRSAAQRLVRDALGNAQDTLQSRVGGARSQAQGTWDSLESLFQNRVQRAMRQLGVPTAEDIRQLSARVAELNANVQRIDASERRERRTASTASARSGKPAAAARKKSRARRRPDTGE
jgi:poly(hydroxyalkanoate) granule-associated protein